MSSHTASDPPHHVTQDPTVSDPTRGDVAGRSAQPDDRRGKLRFVAQQLVENYVKCPGSWGIEISLHAVTRRSKSLPSTQQTEHFDIEGLRSQLSLLMITSGEDDVELLSIEGLNHLEILHLEGLKVSHDVLLAVIEASAATLQVVTFEDMNLTSGTWEEVFLALRNLEHLCILNVGCRYDRNGDSARYSVNDGQRYEVMGLLSARREDLASLWGLQDHTLARKRAYEKKLFEAMTR